MNISLKSLWLAPLALSMSLAACGTDDTAPAASDPPLADPPAAGALDPSFGVGGIAELDLPGYPGGFAIANDRIYACSADRPGANLDLVVRRFMMDGSLDTGFGMNGEIRFSAPGYDFSCRQIVAMADGAFAVLVKTDNGLLFSYLDAQGVPDMNRAALIPNGRARVQGDQLLVSMGGTNTLAVLDMMSITAMAQGTIGGSPDRPYAVGGTAFLPGSYTSNMVTGWGIASAAPGQPLALMASPLAQGGNPNVPDTMRDSVMLPDGSIIAVGSADLEAGIMVAHLGAGDPVVQTNTMGSSSTGYAVALDGQNRPVVVGAATIDGHQQYMWQRHDASLAIDASYEAGGVVLMPAPSGSGELVGVIHHEGAMWALGTIDIESGAARSALLKIAE